MKGKILIVLCVLFSVMTVQAGLLEHLTFDAAGSDPVLGTAASIDTVDMMAGAGSLALSGAPTTDTSGDDGAVTATSYDWSGSDIRTVAFWMKAVSGDTGDANPTMISLGSGTGGGNRFDIRLTGDALRLEVQAGGYTTSSIIADGTWHHVAVVVPVDPATVSNAEYYIDGSYVGNFSSGTALATGVGPLRVGDSYQDVGRDFKGNIDDVRLYDTALDSTEIATLFANSSSVASNPVPGNDEPGVALNTNLKWDNPGDYDATNFALNIRATDANWLDTGTIVVASVTDLDRDGDPNTTEADMPAGILPLTNLTTYYWRVISTDPNTPGTPVDYVGPDWSFTTVTALPVIDTEPESKTAVSADLFIEASNPEVYTWYQVGTPDTVVQTTGTLGTPTAASDTYTTGVEGHYYCVVSNTSGSVTSETVRVMTPRLVGHWNFDENLVSTVTTAHTGTYVDPNESAPAPTPTYTTVSDANNLAGKGQAFIFDGDNNGGLHVQIGGDANDFNFYPTGYTVNAWVKTTEIGYGASVAKQALNKSLGFVLSHNGGTALHAYDPDTNEVLLYVDGELVDVGTKTDILTNDQPLIFGAETASGLESPYSGLLDEVSIWSYPRTKEQIGQEYYDVTGVVPCINPFDGSVYDFDDNCIVDLADFAKIAQYWLDSGLLPI
jgi:hypothetical protein